MATVIDLGQKVKAKYPEYNNMTDWEVGTRVKAKYPEYSDFTDVPNPDAKPTNPLEGGVMGTIANTLFKNTGELVGQAVGTVADLGKAVTTPGGVQQLINAPTDQFKQIYPFLGRFVDQPASQVIKHQAGVALGTAAEQAPFSSTLQSVASTAGGRILGTAVKSGGIVGAATTAQGLKDNLPALDVAKQGAIGALAGAAVGGGLQALGEGAVKLMEKWPEHLYNNALGVKAKDILAGKSPSGTLIKKGVIGTLGSIQDAQEAVASEAQSQIADTLQNSTKTVNFEQMFSDIADSLNTTYKSSFTPLNIKEYVASVAPQVSDLINQTEVPIQDANLVRSSIDEALGSRAFMGAQMPFKKQVVADVTNTLRETVKGLEPDVRPLFSDWSTAIRTTDAIDATLARRGASDVLSLKDIGAAGVGGVIKGGPGAIVGYAGRKLIESPAVKTLAAVGLDRVVAAMTYLNQLPGTTRLELLQAISQEITKKR